MLDGRGYRLKGVSNLVKPEDSRSKIKDNGFIS